MATVANSSFGRKAYGAQRTMSAGVKARHVAASIAARLAEGRAWSFTDYGLEGNAAQQALVLAALAQTGGAA
jgi:hypothetical protein